MTTSTIQIDVLLDEQRLPQKISWTAGGTSAEDNRLAKGMLLALWDGDERTALRIDLWTKDMMVDEMADFFYQTFITMADTYERSTKNVELTQDIKKFAEDFYNKFRQQGGMR